MTLREDVQQYITECYADQPWTANTSPIVKQFSSWEARELVALGAILILMGATSDLDETMRATCRLHDMMHIYQDMVNIVKNSGG